MLKDTRTLNAYLQSRPAPHDGLHLVEEESEGPRRLLVEPEDAKVAPDVSPVLRQRLPRRERRVGVKVHEGVVPRASLWGRVKLGQLVVVDAVPVDVVNLAPVLVFLCSEK